VPCNAIFLLRRLIMPNGGSLSAFELISGGQVVAPFCPQPLPGLANTESLLHSESRWGRGLAMLALAPACSHLAATLQHGTVLLAPPMYVPHMCRLMTLQTPATGIQLLLPLSGGAEGVAVLSLSQQPTECMQEQLSRWAEQLGRAIAQETKIMLEASWPESSQCKHCSAVLPSQPSPAGSAISMPAFYFKIPCRPIRCTC
jgi:hypothetical protein